MSHRPVRDVPNGESRDAASTSRVDETSTGQRVCWCVVDLNLRIVRHHRTMPLSQSASVSGSMIIPSAGMRPEPFALVALTEEIDALMTRIDVRARLNDSERLQLLVLWDAMKICLRAEASASR
jgi:hypothetical protein